MKSFNTFKAFGQSCKDRRLFMDKENKLLVCRICGNKYVEYDKINREICKKCNDERITKCLK